MTVQLNVNAGTAFGIPGASFLDGAIDADPWTLETAANGGSAANNIIGSTALTYVSDGVCMAGGTGVFVGILGSPKEHVINSPFAAGAYAPSMTLPDGTICTAIRRHSGLIVLLPAAANVGDILIYNTTTGQLATKTPGAAVPGGFSLFNLATYPSVIRYQQGIAGNGLAVVKI
jgi:hypothetical protein